MRKFLTSFIVNIFSIFSFFIPLSELRGPLCALTTSKIEIVLFKEISKVFKFLLFIQLMLDHILRPSQLLFDHVLRLLQINYVLKLQNIFHLLVSLRAEIIIKIQSHP